MSKNIKKASAILQERETQRAAAIAKAEKELNETTAKLKATKEKLDAANDTEEYKKLLSELRDLEAVELFCNKKLNEAKGVTLSSEDYKNIVATAKDNYQELCAGQGAAILAELDKVLNMFDAFDKDIRELNALLAKAAKLTGKTPIVYYPEQIAPISTKSGDLIRELSRVRGAYMQIDRLNKRP